MQLVWATVEDGLEETCGRHLALLKQVADSLSAFFVDKVGDIVTVCTYEGVCV